MPKLLVTGDWHTDRFTRGVPRADDVLAQVDTMVDAANSHAVDLLLCLGDLFNGHDPDERVWTLLYRLRGSLKRARMPTLFVNGNHDVVDRVGCLSALAPLAMDGLDVADDVALFMYNVGSASEFQVLALPHVSRAHANVTTSTATKHIEQAAARILAEEIKPDVPLIAAGHLELADAVRGSEAEMLRGELVWFPQCILDSDRVDEIVNGHYHKAQKIGRVIVPGSPERHMFSERDDSKSYLILEM